MRVLIDARSAATSERTGVGTYTLEMLRRLPAVDPATTFVAWYLNARAVVGAPRAFGDIRRRNLEERGTPIPARWFDPLASFARMPRVEWLARFDVLFAPNFVPPPTRAPRVVVTVHDLAFRRFPETAPASTRRWLADFDASLERAASILAISEATKRDLVELCGVDEGRITVTPLGVDRDVYRPVPDEEARAAGARAGVHGPYLLALGGIEPRKNLGRVIDAFAGLSADGRPRLVIAGSGVRWNPEGRYELQAALARLPAETRDRVVLPGYVAERDKVALMSGARALIFPSLYEGFGLPVLEAMACGTPVLTSNASSLPEVAGEAALLVDPRDVDSIRRGMERLLGDDHLRNELRRAGLSRAAAFSWDETARRTAAVLREA